MRAPSAESTRSIISGVDPISKFQEYSGRSPEDAKFFWSGGPVEVAPKTWFASIFSGSTTFETDEGLVVVDAGMDRLGPGIAALIRQRTQAPVHTAIYTHGHVDHAYGLRAFLVEGQPRPRIVGHALRRVRYQSVRYLFTVRCSKSKEPAATSVVADPAVYWLRDARALLVLTARLARAAASAGG